jgi:hypothetical protein
MASGLDPDLLAIWTGTSSVQLQARLLTSDPGVGWVPDDLHEPVNVGYSRSTFNPTNFSANVDLSSYEMDGSVAFGFTVTPAFFICFGIAIVALTDPARLFAIIPFTNDQQKVFEGFAKFFQLRMSVIYGQV